MGNGTASRYYFDRGCLNLEIPEKGSRELKPNKIDIVHLGGYVSFNHNLRYICPKWSTLSKVKPNSCLRQCPVFIILKISCIEIKVIHACYALCNFQSSISKFCFEKLNLKNHDFENSKKK